MLIKKKSSDPELLYRSTVYRWFTLGSKDETMFYA